MKFFLLLISIVYGSEEALHHLNDALSKHAFEKYIVQTDTSIDVEGFSSNITRLEPGICYQSYARVQYLKGLEGAYFQLAVQGNTLKIKVTQTPTPFFLIPHYDTKDPLKTPLHHHPYMAYFKSTFPHTFDTQTNYDALLARLSVTPYDAPLHIPLKMHTIWFTDPASPRLPKEKCFRLLRNTMSVCASGWQQTLWVHNLTNCPELVKSPTKDTEFDAKVQVKEIAPLFDHPDVVYFKPRYEEALGQGNYGKASDIARVVVLWFEGGAYRDTDFTFLQDPRRLHQVCDFYCGFEDPHSIALNNAMIASAPRHPALKRYMDLMVSPPTLPAGFANTVHQTLFHTGPFAMTRAVCTSADNASADPLTCALPMPIFYAHNSSQIIALGSHGCFKEWVPHHPNPNHP